MSHAVVSSSWLRIQQATHISIRRCNPYLNYTSLRTLRTIPHKQTQSQSHWDVLNHENIQPEVRFGRKKNLRQRQWLWHICRFTEIVKSWISQWIHEFQHIGLSLSQSVPMLKVRESCVMWVSVCAFAITAYQSHLFSSKHVEAQTVQLPQSRAGCICLGLGGFIDSWHQFESENFTQCWRWCWTLANQNLTTSRK